MVEPSLPRVVLAGRHALLETGNDVSYTTRYHTLHVYDYAVRLTADGRSYDLDAGDAAMARGGAKVHYKAPQPSWHYVFHFGFDADAETIPPFTVFRLGSARSTVLDECHRIQRDLASGGLWGDRCAATGLYRLICHLHALGEQVTNSMSKAQRALQRATDWIDTHLHLPIRVEDLAREVDLDRNYLARKFKDAYGETILEYVRRQRIRRAQHWLANTDLPIKVIALDLGFYDLQHFYRCFKAQTGLTPGVCRERGTENYEDKIQTYRRDPE